MANDDDDDNNNNNNNNNNNSIQFFIIYVPSQQLNANYRHSTVYILVIQYSQIKIIII
jgi:hypothetical protein